MRWRVQKRADWLDLIDRPHLGRADTHAATDLTATERNDNVDIMAARMGPLVFAAYAVRS